MSSGERIELSFEIGSNLKEVLLELIKTCPKGVRPSFAVHEGISVFFEDQEVASNFLSELESFLKKRD